MTKMKANIFRYLACGLVAVAAVSLPSCESFEVTNTDPNSVTEAQIKPIYLASRTFVASTLGCDQWQRIINLGTDTFAQYFCNDKYSTNQCEPNNEYTENFWNTTYTWVYNLNRAIEMCDDSDSDNNIKQMCRIWRVWVYSRLTDLLGDIPYSQACRLDDYPEPAYDSQKDIYYDMLSELADASSSLIMSAPNTVNGYDFFFGGDWLKWQQLANTLRLRLAMRMTEVDPAKAKVEAEAAAKATGGLLLDDMTIWKAKDAYTTFVGYNMFYPYGHYWPSRLTLSTSMEKILTNLGGVPVEKQSYYQDGCVPDYADPRALIMFNVTSDGTLASVQRHREKNPETGKNEWVIDFDYRGRWQGVRPGLSAAVVAEADNINTNNPRIGAFFISNDPTPPVTVAPEISYERDQVLVYGNESYFLLAEAALRGYNVGGSAKSFYEQGIRKAMETYGNLINSADIESYLTSTMKSKMGTSVSFDDADSDLGNTRNSKLMKIMTQKYIGGFPEDSFEAWNDYRRTGMPALDPFEMPLTGYVMEAKAMDYKGSLRRLIYPAIEQTLNPTMYKKASEQIGGDNTTTRMWWDCRTAMVE